MVTYNTTVLVTGAGGFIGSHVAYNLLKENYNVVAIDNFNNLYDPNIKRENIKNMLNQLIFIEGDIRDSSTLKKAFSYNIDTVIHLAACAGVRFSISNPEVYIDNNITGTCKLLQSSSENKVKRFIFGSSSSVYGNNTEIPFKETHSTHNTISPYAMSKIAGEQLCSNFSHISDIQTMCLRFFTVYGPRMRPDLAIYKFTNLINKNLPIELYGDGSSLRDYTYIDDIVNGILLAVKHSDITKAFDTFNLGYGKTTSLNDLISKIGINLQKEPIIIHKPSQLGDVNTTYADISKAKCILNYNPQTTIDEGISKFVNWFISNR